MKDSFKYQCSVDVSELTRYLTAIIEGLESGALRLQENEHAFSVHPRGLIDLGLKARFKNGRARISLDMAWAEDEVALPLLSGAAEEVKG